MDETINVLTALVAFPTVSHQPNQELIQFVTDYLGKSAAIAAQYTDESSGKTSLLYRFGPDAPGGVILSGHTDVVPVEESGWHNDPFSLTQQDGKLFGRGSTDMKGFIALATTSGKNLSSELKRPIYLALTYDEEVGCLAAPLLIKAFAGRIPEIQAVIVGEPTSLRPVSAHKGISEFVTTFKGKAAHSSKPHLGIHAINLALDYMAGLRRLGEDMQRRPAPANADCHPTWATSHIGTVHGGSATNIIPEKCRISYDLRSFQADDLQYFTQELDALRQRVLSQHDLPAEAITTRQSCDVPPLEPRPDSPAARLASELSGQSLCEWVPYAAEAGQYQQAGFPTVLLGPGSIEQAHQTNEYIEIAQLNEALAIMEKLFSRQSRDN